MVASLIIHTDGGSRGNPGPAAIGVAVLDEKGLVIHELHRYIGEATNNEAEYQAVIDALEWLSQSQFATLDVVWKLDSKLVVEQVSKNWKIKEPRMSVLARKIWLLLDGLQGTHSFTYVPRAQNALADALVNQALDAQLA